jgi:hypothetical protein
MAQHEIQGVHLVQQSIEKSMMKKAWASPNVHEM